MSGKSVAQRRDIHTIVADVNGTMISWTNGYFSSEDQKLTHRARLIGRLGDQVACDPVEVVYGAVALMPGSGTPLRAMATLFDLFPGRVRLVQSDDEIDLYLARVGYGTTVRIH